MKNSSRADSTASTCAGTTNHHTCRSGPITHHILAPSSVASSQKKDLCGPERAIVIESASGIECLLGWLAWLLGCLAAYPPALMMTYSGRRRTTNAKSATNGENATKILPPKSASAMVWSSLLKRWWSRERSMDDGGSGSRRRSE